MLALALAALTFVACGDDDDDDDDDGGDEILVGALLDLTGDWQTLGQASEAALAIAAEQINAHFEEADESTRVRVIVKETGLDPATALEKLQELADEGVHVVVGPQSSSEAREVLDFAADNGILLVSQGSTASALTLPGDNLFRLPPDDRAEAAAVVALAVQDGIDIIVPVWRDDLGNQGLRDSVAAGFTKAGGTVTEGVMYPAGQTEFADIVPQISQQVATALEVAGEGRVAIYLAAFNEVVGLFNDASADEVLSSIPWYGSSSIARIAALTGDENAATFATAVGYPNPIFGLDPSDEAIWQPVAGEIEERSGQDADAFALSAYDALYVIVKAVQDAGIEDIEALKTAFATAAEGHHGVTGPLVLNPAGDRAEAPFDFWLVCQAEGGYEWDLGGTFLPATGEVSGAVSCGAP
jgi:branched-chain amino acid transport system substrate-binding protein